jgi:hypothetical protein
VQCHTLFVRYMFAIYTLLTLEGLGRLADMWAKCSTVQKQIKMLRPMDSNTYQLGEWSRLGSLS